MSEIENDKSEEQATPFEPEAVEASDAEDEEEAAPARHLLLVDDDEHILRSLKIYLEMENFQVTTAASGREALEKVEAERPHLVVLDVMMPELDGFEVLERMKGDAATASIPVIMLTARGQDADVLRGYQRGAASYMTKPVNYDELVDNINLIFDNEDNPAAKGKTYDI